MFFRKSMKLYLFIPYIPYIRIYIYMYIDLTRMVDGRLE